MQHSLATQRNAGFGLGLRTAHYQDFLREPQPVDWLEIITDNYLVDGGKPLVLLDQIRRDYPLVMHGVAMSIGEAGGVDAAYLQRVKALADRVQPLWISDHLCWTGQGAERLHDLFPLPYTDEAARHVIAQIRRAQDVLQRRFVIENVSSYIQYRQSACAEWQFLSHIAGEADCLLLLDVNNIYVSGMNHGFDPLDYLAGLPAHRIQQIHLAGHSGEGSHLIDTHDHPVAPEVWALYREACRRFGAVPAMIERDDHIPALAELLDELATARGLAAEVAVSAQSRQPFNPSPDVTVWHADGALSSAPLPALAVTQRRIADYVLERDAAEVAKDLLVTEPRESTTRLDVYRNAYVARLAENLADSFARVALYMGSQNFDAHARAFALREVPAARNLGRYGERFPDHLASCYPAHPELHELARLDWDLRCCFDGADAPALSAEAAAVDHEGRWLLHTPALHASVCLREITTNVVPIWRAIDEDVEVPAAQPLAAPLLLAVWRKGLQPHFRTMNDAEAAFIRMLAAGRSIADAAQALSHLAPELLAGWLREWWADGLLAATVSGEAHEDAITFARTREDDIAIA